MLESLSLRHFQTHVKRTIHFDPRVTTIIGPTDSGKSSLLRALRWVCLNQFDGPADSFIHWDAGFSRVRLRVDGHVITRRKGSVNSYDLDGREFKAFGSEKVPEEVGDFLAVASINFQNQFDSHFWIADSAGQVSRDLNQIVNLGVIDDALGVIASRSRATNAEETVCRSRLSDARTSRDALSFVADADESLRRLESQATARAAKNLKNGALNELLAFVDATRSKALKTASAAKAGQSVVSAGETALRATQKAATLRKLVSDIADAREVAKLPELVLPSPDKVHQLSLMRSGLATLLERIAQTEEQKCQTASELAETNEQLRKMSKGQRCPVCRSPMS